MPQFDLSTFPPQLIWLAITFVALYLLMTRVGLPKVGGIIKERQSRIETAFGCFVVEGRCGSGEKKSICDRNSRRDAAV